jgi:CheY-like chemotaxis protein
MASENAPDLVLLDIRLPDFDGFEVCRQLRHMHGTRNVPIIFLTERQGRNDRLTGLELGAVDYVTKPFDIQELHLRIRNTLRRANFPTLQNAITDLPESELVQETLLRMLSRSDWGLVHVSLKHLSAFRDHFGFVAADDVLRAVGVILNNALKALPGNDGFIGHVGAGSFVLITSAGQCDALAESCRERLALAIPYFYPVDGAVPTPAVVGERLAFTLKTISSQAQAIDSLEALQKQLQR